jgi:sigma-B regulation protein RsbU (phosphoserine phosphatase)
VTQTGGAPALDAFLSALLDDDPEELYDRAPCGYLTTTPDGVLVKVNQTFLTMTGHTREELVGRVQFVELLSAGGRIYHETHYAQLIRMHGEAREIALEIVRADGQRLPVLVNSVLERDSQGAPRVVRTAVFDARQRREYERELLLAKDRAEASEARARALARTLQQTLIPPVPPQIAHLDIAAAYRPAGTGAEVGGDFYDVFQVADDDWAVVLGDVCGKGTDAAVITALVRYTVRAAAVQHADPAEVLAVLNTVLQRHETDRFCTVVFLRVRREEGRWRATVSSGGHPMPLLRRADGRFEDFGHPGRLLGVLDETSLHDDVVDLHLDDVLLLYTDGLPDGRSNDEVYGEERIRSVVSAAGSSAESITSALLEDVVAFQDGTTRDDIAIVTLRVPD